jgi:uncharacterized repeat protein (TIGR01451 family)
VVDNRSGDGGAGLFWYDVDLNLFKHAPSGPGGCGGGVLNRGHLTIRDSVILGNTAGDGGARSGGAALPGAGGDGGGLCHRGAALVVERSTIAENQGAAGHSSGRGGGGGHGGGVILAGVSPVSFVGSTISGNTTGAGGGSAPAGAGGGIYLQTGTLEMVNTTISGNVAGTGGYGGGLVAASGAGPATLTSVTVAFNRAPITAISAGLVGQGPAGQVQVLLRNSIVAGNHITGAPGAFSDCAGPVASQGHNLIGSVVCSLTPTDGDLVPGQGEVSIDPVLAPLAPNGGSTDTHALLAGSPAIDTADDEACEGTDQRGATRPADGDGVGGARCDIGAFELAPVDLAVSVAAAPGTGVVGDPLTYTITVSNVGLVPVGDVTLTDTLPADATLESATASQGGCEGTGPLTCAIGLLAPGGAATVAITVTPTSVGSLTNTAVVIGFAGVSGVEDGFPDNNTAVTTTPVGLVRAGPGGDPNPVGGRRVVQTSLDVAEVPGLGFAWSASCPGFATDGVFSDAAAQAPSWTPPSALAGRPGPGPCVLEFTVTSPAGSQTVSYVHQVGRTAAGLAGPGRSQ